MSRNGATVVSSRFPGANALPRQAQQAQVQVLPIACFCLRHREITIEA